MEKFKFTPESGFRDGTAYPNPTSEANTREMFQRPLDQLRDYVNQLLGIIPTDEQLQQMVTNHDLILELEKAVKQLEENSNSYAEYDEETGNLQINSAMDILALFKQLSNPNLLINSDFRNPVNQRGQTTYNCGTSKTYTIDRWHGWEVTVDVNDGYISISTDKTNGFQQEFENSLPQNDYTLSVNVKSISGTVKAIIYNPGATEKLLSVGLNTLSFNGSIKRVLLYLEAGSSIDVEYIKLEQGSIATPFVPRQYSEELALCQRYYIAYGSDENDAMFLCHLMTLNESVASGALFLPCTMRAKPTVTAKVDYLMYQENGFTSKAVTEISLQNISQNVIRLYATCSSALTVGRHGVLESKAPKCLEFDAEIY